MPSVQEAWKRWKAKLSLLKLFQRSSNVISFPAPSVPCGVPYLYKPIPRGYIRLLTIDSLKWEPATYRLVTYEQRRAPEYDAVSYCWGEDLTSTIINCDGAELRIRKSLSVALPYLADRPVSARPLWIDAICLNQEDNNEKAIHVPLMHKIYKSAARTVVWLGESDEGTDIALDFMAEAISYLGSGGDPQILNRKRLKREWKALREYLQRPWFNRLWALQEVLISDATEILCSSKKTRVLTWQSLEKFLDLIRNHDLHDNLLDTPVQPGDGLNSIYINLSVVQATRVQLREYGYILFDRLLYLIRMRSCHEPVDKIWALLGLLPHPLVEEIQQKNIIDYSHAGKRDYWKSYLAFMKVLYAVNVQNFHKTLLVTVEYPRHALLPSWCPDLLVNTVNIPFRILGDFRAGFVNYKETDNMSFTAELDSVSNALSMDGFCVDEVKSVTCVYPGEDEDRVQHERTRAVWFQECEQTIREILGDSDEAIEALAEVLLAVDHEVKEKFSGKIAHCYRCLRGHQQSSPIKPYSCPHDRGEKHRNYDAEVNIACTNRKVFVTSNGRIGLGPVTLEIGDKICVFVGADMLCVLRSTEHKNSKYDQEQQVVQGKQPGHVQLTFSLIGDAYVRGLMYGEAFTAESRGPESRLVIV